jgi:hypothetical protein
LYGDMVGKRVGKRTRGRTKSRWKDTIKMKRELRWEGLVWFILARERDKWPADVSSILNHRVS